MKTFETFEDVLKTVEFEGKLLPGFSGIGRLRGRQDYSEDETTVLNHFFTNINSNVYCAKDTMPNEFWALIMGQYARSNLTARDRLLVLFQDMETKKKGIPVSEVAAAIKKHGDITELLEKHMKEAGKFIEEYGIAYGHASLRDSGTIRICFEGVSQRITKFLEAAREGAYQEQSTRALPFKVEHLGMPYEIRGTEFENVMMSMDLKLIKFYDRLYSSLVQHLHKKFAHLRAAADKEIADRLGGDDIKLTDRDWNGIIEAKAFDVARYLLPQNMTTSLGVTLNTRRFQDVLTEWQSSHLWEMRMVGRAAQIESMKISPELMKHGNPSPYFMNLRGNLDGVFAKYAGRNTDFEYTNEYVSSVLIAHTQELEDFVLASILLNGSDGSRSLFELKDIVKRLGADERREIAEAAAKGKGEHDIFSKSLEIGSLTFERVYDIGAYRDLHRQRGDRQQVSPYSVVGYSMPVEVAEVGMDKEFVASAEEVKKLYDYFGANGLSHVGEYVPMMANTLLHVATMDPGQQFYQAKLRCQAAGIDSYRTISLQEVAQTLEIMPSFKGLVPYDATPKYDLGRLPEKVEGIVRKNKK